MNYFTLHIAKKRGVLLKENDYKNSDYHCVKNRDLLVLGCKNKAIKNN